MKRLVLVFLILLFSLVLQANEKAFKIQTDGAIQVDGQQFKSLAEYVGSDYFRQNGKRCGTMQYLRRHQLREPLGSQSDCSMSKTTIKSEYYPSQVLIIPIYWHVIYNSGGTGNISAQKIYDQIEVLNEDFRAIAGTQGGSGNDTMIQFELIDITRTQNNTWFNDQNEYTFKNTLGRDQDRYLNIYSNSASGYLGYSTLPQYSAGNVYDGVVVLYEAVGGRNNGFSSYDQGRTLVHEIGHYLGMLHTFGDEDTCGNGYTVGDLINDTPSENAQHYGCTQTYSCGTADPIHNYMNYTDDSCMTEFSQEQGNRMVCSLVNYRPNLYSTGGISSPSITVTSPNGGETLTAGGSHTIKWSSSGTVGNVKIEYSTNNGSSWSTVKSSTSNDGGYTWSVPSVSSSQCLVRISEASDGSPSDTSNSTFSIGTGGGGSGTISLDRSQLYYTALTSGTATGSQNVWLTASGTGSIAWTVSTGTSWLSATPSSGSGSGQLTVSVNTSGLSTGTYSGVVTLSSNDATNSPQTVAVQLTVKSTGQDSAPQGSFATPFNGSTVSGSVPVTGWAIDDVGLQGVKIYRETSGGGIPIGDAVFVDGARPDIESSYPGYPMNYQAGWGYMMLTNFLPNGGNGTFTIYALATDVSGKTTRLGSATIYCNNSSAVKPFGAIETPTQGGIASGSSFDNWGWVLTPPPNTVPTDGSTITVQIDSVSVGNPAYNLYRGDIAAMFPGYNNSNGAFGLFTFDTTGYEDGVHTIQWVARDNGGNQDGIGSRYFTIQNSGSRESSSTARRGASMWSPEQFASLDTSAPIGVKHGFSEEGIQDIVHPGKDGIINVSTKELQRIVIHLAPEDQASNSPNSKFKIQNSKFVTGNLLVGERLYPLPIGSTLDVKAAKFYWSPGVGFSGKYELVFFDINNKTQKRVNITINPRY